MQSDIGKNEVRGKERTSRNVASRREADDIFSAIIRLTAGCYV